MGEARKRGTYAKRKQSAVQKKIEARILKRNKRDRKIIIISVIICVADLLYNYFHYFRETL